MKAMNVTSLEAHQIAALVEFSDDAIISKTLDGIIVTWNRGAEKIYGYSAEEVIGQSVLRLLPSNRPDELPELLARISRGEEGIHCDTIRQKKDG